MNTAILTDKNQSALNWASVIGGAVVASALSIALLILGSGLGWATIAPWSGFDYTATQLTVTAAIWLVIMQWVSSAMGGYMAGRLRTRWTEIPTDEVVFRDTAHGFLAWCLATILVAALLTSAMATAVTTGGQVIAAEKVSEQSADHQADILTYPVDTLFRTSTKARVSDDVRQEAAQITMRGITNDVFPQEDKDYLRTLVVANTGVTPEAADERVNALMFQVDALKVSADEARKAGATFALVTFLSMLMGAFIASLAAVWGGRHRDTY
jgi:hypothetical protein